MMPEPLITKWKATNLVEYTACIAEQLGRLLHASQFPNGFYSASGSDLSVHIDRRSTTR